jgi:ribosomal protein S18 acetylase RimI-like enzyme
MASMCEHGAEPPSVQAMGWRRAAAAGLTFRPITDADLPFLARVYATTRTEELAPVPWPDAQKAAFCDMQFQAQHAHYMQTYAGADWLLMLHHGEAVGRLYVVEWAREHRIIDIAFLPEHRGRGLGTAVMHDLLDRAAAAGKAVSIHVEQFNPARRLYHRLGFSKIGEHGVYELMRCLPRPT